MSECIRINTGVAQTLGFSETIEGPERAEWDAMHPLERAEYLNNVAHTTLSQVDAWATVVDE